MKLSKNFTLAEITHSNTAKRLGIKNEPSKKHLQNIQTLITSVLPVSYTHLTLPTILRV